MTSSWRCSKCTRIRAMAEVESGADCLLCRIDQTLPVTGIVTVYKRNGMHVVATHHDEDDVSRNDAPLHSNDPAWMCPTCERVPRVGDEIRAGLDCLYCRAFEMLAETGDTAEIVFDGDLLHLNPPRPPSMPQPPSAATETSVSFLTDIIHELRHDILGVKRGLAAVESMLTSVDHRLDRMERRND